MPLNNSGPPQRRTPLERGKPLESRSQLRRTPFVTTPTTRKVPVQRTALHVSLPKVARPRDTGPTIIVKRQVDKRDIVCLVCGGPASNRQHREGRGSGGRGKEHAERTNGVSWLFRVCGMGNTSGCHQKIDLDPLAYAKGWKIRRNGLDVDASQVPVLCYDGWHLLAENGRRVECPEPEGYADELYHASLYLAPGEPEHVDDPSEDMRSEA